MFHQSIDELTGAPLADSPRKVIRISGAVRSVAGGHIRR